MSEPHLYVWLQERYPVTFPQERTDIRPLKVNIHLDILTAHPELDDTALRRALACWCGRPAYQKALMRGGPRVDLHGEPAGEVIPDQVRHAQEKLKALADRAKDRKAAATKPAEARSGPSSCQDIPEVSPQPPRVPSKPILSLKRKAGT